MNNPAAGPVLKQVEQILTPGTLEQKLEQISLFLAGGNSTQFTGDVNWKVTLPDDDRAMKGDAESIDEAMTMIKGVIEELIERTGPAAKVAVSVKEKE
jgi:hypothetical protein